MKKIKDPLLIEMEINTLADEFFTIMGECRRLQNEEDVVDEEELDQMYIRMAEIVQELGVTGRKALVAEHPELKFLFRDLNKFRKENTH